MKNILKRFSCVFLSVLVLCSFCVPLSVSADGFLSSFSAIPLADKSYAFKDNELIYKYLTVFRDSYDDTYYFYFHGNKYDYDSLELNYYNYVTFYKSKNRTTGDYCGFMFDSNGEYKKIEERGSGYYIYYNPKGLGITLDKFVENIVYSDIPLTYNNNVVFDPSQSHYVEIADFLHWGQKPIESNNSLYGMYMDFDDSYEAFINWLIDNNYVEDLAKFGLKNASSNLSSVVNIWWNNKFSPTLVFELLKNNGLKTVEYARNMISWFNTKWNEFQSSKYVSINYPPGITSHHRADKLIQDDIDDDGNVTDSTEISLLREILNQLLITNSYLYKTLNSYLDNIATNIYSLNLYMSDFLSYLQQMPEIILKLVDINDTLQNLDFGGGSSILPGSSSYNEDNLFTFLDIKTQEIIEELDYQLTPQPIPEEYSLGSVVGDKFAFVKQIRDYNAITYDYDFFNDSLIDTNDGLQNVLSADVDVLYLPVVASAPVSNSSRAVMYAGVVSPDVPSIEDKTRPDFNFNFGGLFGSDASVSVLDFSIFDEYKHLINVFVIALCWSAYLRRLYKKLPELLRSGVYDVSDSKE